MVHKAGVPVNDVQYCERCGLVLRDSRIPITDSPLGQVGSPYPTGMTVEVTDSWQAMCFSTPNCTRVRKLQNRKGV